MSIFVLQRECLLYVINELRRRNKKIVYLCYDNGYLMKFKSKETERLCLHLLKGRGCFFLCYSCELPFYLDL